MENRATWLPDPSTWKNSWKDDWRLMGQEGYLVGKHLQHRRFCRELCRCDFDQCDFCWMCFDDKNSIPVRAYFVPDEQLWICETCYNDFKDYFQWTVQEVDE